MRVAIDLTALNAEPSGIDRYLVGMVRSLAQLEKRADFFLFINLEDRARFFGPNKLPVHCHVLPICFRPRFVRLFFQQILQPILLYALRIDVLHSPTFIMPAWRGRARHVLTIHDMSSFIIPQHHPRIRRGPLYERIVRASIVRADLVSVPSAAVKEDILQLVPGIGADRIHVIPCGIDHGFRPRDLAEVAPVLERLKIPTPYVLFVGTIDPRKNLPLLIEAFAQLIECERPENLVVAGGASWSPPNESLKRDRVYVTGYIDEKDLPFVYAGAALFVYPSLLEGFGFPPLEAMACGVPVVASDNSSLHENLGGAANLVPLNDAFQLAEAMQVLLADEEARTRAISAGLERSRSFRWDNFARETFALYEAVL